jgi:hypothetical protein
MDASRNWSRTATGAQNRHNHPVEQTPVHALNSAPLPSWLPDGVSVDPGERLVIIPRKAILAARADIPDA